MNLYQPTIIHFESEDQLYKNSEDYITEQVFDIVSEHGLARLLLSGGQTPIPLYKRLGSSAIFPWESIELYQTDERVSEQTSTESNPNITNQVRIQEAIGYPSYEYIKEFHKIRTDSLVDFAVQDYQEKLDSIDNPLFDLAILGIGDDGHIASLFPSTNNLFTQENQLVIPTIAPDRFESTQRISLTAQAILDSSLIFVMLSGSNKRDVVLELMEGNKSVIDFPAKIILAHPKVMIYQWLDQNSE